MKVSTQGKVISIAAGVITLLIMASEEGLIIGPAVTAIVWAVFSKFEKSSNKDA